MNYLKRGIMQSFLDIIFIVLGLLVSILLFYGVLRQWENAKKLVKFLLCCVFVACACGVGVYAYKQSKINAKIQEFQNAFKNGDTLICVYKNEQINVDKTGFIYFSDLFTFSGKNELKNINVPILSCKQHINAKDSEMLND